MEEIQQDNKDNDLEAPQNTKTRDSTTNRQLRQKALREKSLPAQEYIRQQIFRNHVYTDQDCKNNGQYYYVIKLSGNHHMVTLDDQNKWTGLVGILPDITINTPPADWIKGYLEYEKLIPKKKQARSTKKDVKDE
jgi:hypothetical protein